VNVLAISGRFRHAAAAVAVDGRVVAAVSEDALSRVAGQGYTGSGAFPVRAVHACLERSGLSAADLDRATVVEGESSVAEADPPAGRHAAAWFEDLSGRSKAEVTVDAIRADALQAAAAGPAGAVLVCGTEPAMVAGFVRQDDRLVPDHRFDGSGLLAAARHLVSEVGLSAADPFQALDRLSVGGEPEFLPGLADAIRWCDEDGPVVDRDRLSAAVREAEHAASGRLADASSLNVRVQESRRALAASFTRRLAEVIGDAVARLRVKADSEQVAFGGALFGNPGLNTELRRLLGDAMSVAAVPEPAGRALGAALGASDGQPAELSGLALGPSYSDDAIKRTLDNCRLEYLYEPDWPRLLRRVSRMLAQGKVVAWFQDGMGFGPRPTGTRSILCDPSSRYARPNVNEYLRQVPLDEPLPLVFAPSRADGCLVHPASRLMAGVDAEVRAQWRPQLVAALDWRDYVRVHAVNPAWAPAFCELLEHHAAATGVPALIETNLAATGEPTACTPRDAIRCVYSSAVDALVIGRFMLMKDHWLLRTDGD